MDQIVAQREPAGSHEGLPPDSDLPTNRIRRAHRYEFVWRSYTPAQLAAIVTALASEAGLCLTPGAQRKAAAAVLAEAEKRHATGNARLAVRLLNQATASQARRVIDASHRLDPAALATICADDIPGQLPLEDPPSDEQRPPGQYL